MIRAAFLGRWLADPDHSIMRINPDFDNMPPSMRPARSPPWRRRADRRFRASAVPALGQRDRHDADARKGAPQLVQRPDGRLKRYFTVAGMKEPNQIAKREPILPPLTLLVDAELLLPSEDEINTNVVLIENTLLEFDIDVDVVDVRVGPTVTQYAVQPFREKTDEAGETSFSRTRISKIASLSSDLALALSAKRLRLETPVPGHNYIGIEVPNKQPQRRLAALGLREQGLLRPGAEEEIAAVDPAGARRGGRTGRHRPVADAPSADRRDDRIGQVGLHRVDGGLAGAGQHRRTSSNWSCSTRKWSN